MPKNMHKGDMKYKITILGSGTSTGIPTIGCKCSTCTSADPRDKRLRCSILVQTDSTNLVIDTTPDFRQQMLKYNVDTLDGIAFTHGHFDHIGGFDDIRAYNFHTRKPMPVYLNEETLEKLSRTFFYAFHRPEQIGGGVPMVDVNIINGSSTIIGDIGLKVIPLKHGKLDVLGYRIGDFAYCTDTNFIPETSYELLQGTKVLIIDALRYHSHDTHFTIGQAIEAASFIKPEITYLIHMAHEVKHAEAEAKLPDNFLIAYDGMVIEI